MSTATTTATATATGSTSFLHGIEQTLGPDMLAKVQTSRLLVVGAGGIGSELLKNLALCGFTSVDVIDLDTIDVSNLNRQLLFRTQHVGQPKCTIACEVATQLLPSSLATNNKYVAHHGNVCDNDQFNVQFAAGFDLVLNALDNVVARRRMNRLCLAAEVPMIEAGTTGYLGQVNVIDKASDTACYECKTQEQQKVYPICTIRSTPSMPVHTIVWAKELYKLLFADNVKESMLYEEIDGGTATDAAAATSVEAAAAASLSQEEDEEPHSSEPSTYMEAVIQFRNLFQSQPQRATPKLGEADVDAILTLTKTLVENLYVDEINKQLGMDRYKTAAKKPEPLASTAISDGLESGITPPPTAFPTGYKTTDVWTMEECVAELVACLRQANEEYGQVLPAFDKDDDMAMRFVTATSNLRNYVFNITPIQSLYECKGIAGNIIPAIATTNAVCAGLQVIQAIHVLKTQLATKKKVGHLRDRCQYINCVRLFSRNGQCVTGTALEDPNPNCYVCRCATIGLAINTTKWNFEEFLETIIKKELGFTAPSINVKGHDVWEEGDDDPEYLATFLPNLKKMLPELPAGGIKGGSHISIDDFVSQLEVTLVVTHSDDVMALKKEKGGGADQGESELSQEEIDRQYIITGGGGGGSSSDKSNGETAVANGDKKPAAAAAAKEEDDDDDDSVLEVFDSNPANEKTLASDTKKRAATTNGNDNDEANKKQKVAATSNGNGVEVIDIDSD